MRTPVLVAVLAGALVLGGTAVAAATSQPPADTRTPSGGDMRQMHERMLRDYPEMGASHNRMLDEVPGMRGMHEQMMGGS